jgi:hypothetical protein
LTNALASDPEGVANLLKGLAGDAAFANLAVTLGHQTQDRPVDALGRDPSRLGCERLAALFAD